MEHAGESGVQLPLLKFGGRPIYVYIHTYVVPGYKSPCQICLALRSTYTSWFSFLCKHTPY